jgi:mRNA interferase MazF
MIAPGDIRWTRFAQPDKRRPVLVLGRRASFASLSQVVVIPISSQIRGLPWEVVLDVGDGVPGRCTLKPEWIRAVQRGVLEARIATFPENRWCDVRHALLMALGLDS